MYDAWAAYDDKAVGTRLGGKLRRPKAERTLANKEKAIAFAAYRALRFVYAEDAEWVRAQFRAKGFDPDDASTDVSTPQGVGNVAAQAVIDYRRHDGANQLGDEKGGDGTPYSDYTGYKPVNTPQKLDNPLRWLPIPFSDGKGGTVTPGYLNAQWGYVKPFALERPEQFRPPPPPAWGSARLNADIEEAVRVNADLTLQQKATVEFMREGPRSTGQSGHWLQFAEDVSRRDHYGLDQDIKLFFSVGNVVMDAFIACWEAKRVYDASRPYWWAQLYYKGKPIEAWAGPGKGTRKIPGGAMASVFTSHLRHAAIPRVCVRPRRGERRRLAHVGALHRKRPLRGDDVPAGRLHHRRSRFLHRPNAGPGRNARHRHSSLEAGRALHAHLHSNGRDGGHVPALGRLPRPSGQRRRPHSWTEDCHVQLA